MGLGLPLVLLLLLLLRAVAASIMDEDIDAATFGIGRAFIVVLVGIPGDNVPRVDEAGNLIRLSVSAMESKRGMQPKRTYVSEHKQEDID